MRSRTSCPESSHTPAPEDPQPDPTPAPSKGKKQPKPAPDSESAEIKTLRAKYAILLGFTKDIRQWALYNDHGTKLKAMRALEQVGEL